MLTQPQRRLFTPLQWALLVVLLMVTAVLVPLAHALLPEGAALRPSSLAVTLAGKYVPHFKPGKELRERVNDLGF